MYAKRIIKRYPNRRLYDPARKRYIKITDIRRLVRRREPFVVIEYGSGADITRYVLLQTILATPQSSKAILTRSFLERVIRAN